MFIDGVGVEVEVGPKVRPGVRPGGDSGLSDCGFECAVLV
jgi:hypothetical protein